MVIVDNCLPNSWAAWLRDLGIEAQHWRDVGAPSAPDTEIMRWAAERGTVVLTHDLDFGILLFRTQALLPSVIQLRLDDVRPAFIGETVLRILAQNEAEFSLGALVTAESGKSRFRLLPLGR